MKGLKFAFTAASLGAVLLGGLSVQAHAQDTTVFAGAGSSAQQDVIAQSIQSHSTKTYTSSTGVSVGPSGNTSSGNFILGVNTTTHKVYFFVTVDSTVGDRAFFNSESINITDGSLQANSNVPINNTTAGLSPKSDADITAALNYLETTPAGRVINVGATDITPADAKFATTRFLKAGYNATTNPIKGFTKTGGQTSVGVADFQLTGAGARAYTLFSIGAVPIIVAVNKSLTGAGHFGYTGTTEPDAVLTNINRFVLAGYLDGTFVRTRDAILGLPTGIGSDASGGDPTTTENFPVITFIREGLSGTYNTIEYCVPNSKEVGSTQDNTTQNPVNTTTPAYDGTAGFAATAGGRVRAIGTGAMVALGNQATATDTLTYGFWSFGNFGSASNLKYITVDGTDPIQDNYSNGAFPTTATAVTFKNVRNGSYPIWSLLRAVTPSPTPADVTVILNGALASDAGGNFVPANQLLVFRSHRDEAGQTGANGNNTGSTSIFGPGPTESGADAGGAVYTLNADHDFYADNGGELTNARQ